MEFLLQPTDGTAELPLTMKGTLSNKLTSFTATLAVADNTDYTGIWQNQSPLAFTNKVATTRSAVKSLGDTGAAQSIKTGGPTAALKTLRKRFETSLHPLARATYQYLKSTGKTEDAAETDLTPTDLHNARAVTLAGIGETVLNLAEPLTNLPAPKTTGDNPPPTPDQFGLTADVVNNVDNLWQQYSTAVGAPIGARAKRKALTAELPGQFAAVEQQFKDLDDLVIQFRDNTGGKGDQFVEAWFNARHVADLGIRHAHAEPTPQPATVTK